MKQITQRIRAQHNLKIESLMTKQLGVTSSSVYFKIQWDAAELFRNISYRTLVPKLGQLTIR